MSCTKIHSEDIFGYIKYIAELKKNPTADTEADTQ